MTGLVMDWYVVGEEGLQTGSKFWFGKLTVFFRKVDCSLRKVSGDRVMVGVGVDVDVGGVKSLFVTRLAKTNASPDPAS